MGSLTKQDNQVCKTMVTAEFPKEELIWENVIPVLGMPNAGWFPSAVPWARRVHVMLPLRTARGCCRPRQEVGCAGLQWAQEADAAGSAGRAVTVTVTVSQTGRGGRGSGGVVWVLVHKWLFDVVWICIIPLFEKLYRWLLIFNFI